MRLSAFNVTRGGLMPLLLCVFLLFGQTLGLLHRVAHGPTVGVSAAAVTVTDETSPVATEATSSFGHAADRIACALFDGTALAAALPGFAVVLALLRAPLLRLLCAAVAVCERRRIAAFRSRAPPRAVLFA